MPLIYNAVPRIFLDKCVPGLNISGSSITTVRIALGGPTTSDTSAYPFAFQYLEDGMRRNTTIGNPSSPCLELDPLRVWRFRWLVKAGKRQVSVRVKQKYRTNAVTPSLTIRKNISVGISSDIVTYASISDDWVTIGPVSFTPTGVGIVYIEVKNNSCNSYVPAYFDHIVTS